MKLRTVGIIVVILLTILLIILLFSFNEDEENISTIDIQKEQEILPKNTNINCNIPRGICENRLGDYPYPFVSNILVIYSEIVDNLILDDIRAGLDPCASISLIQEKQVTNYLEYNNNIIVIGNCENKILKEIVDCNDLKQGETVIELKQLVNNNYGLFLYGNNKEDLRRGAVILKQYDFFRGKLQQTQSSCYNKIKITGSSITI